MLETLLGILAVAVIALIIRYQQALRQLRTAKQAKEELLANQQSTTQHYKDQQELLSMIYNSSSELIGLVKVEKPGEYSILSVNKAYLQAIGQNREELIGLSLSQFCLQVLRNSQEAARKAKERYATVLNTLKPVQYESVAELVNGRRLVLEVTLSPILDQSGHCTHIVDITRDVTSRKQAEDSLKKANKMLSTLISNLPGVVYRCKSDREWSVEFLSAGFKEMTGYDPEPFYDSKLGPSWQHIIHEEDLPRIREAVERASAQKEPYQITYRTIHASGRVRWTWEQGREVYGDQGEVAWREGFMLDITDLKQAQQRLVKSLKERQRFIRKHNKMLEQKVRERTNALEQKSKDLAKANEALQHKNEELRVSEEELRQNGEELHASNEFLTQTQKALDEQNRELQKALQKLKDAQSQLVQSEKMATLGQLTAGIAHEINNPVNYISSGIEGLKIMLEDVQEVLQAYGELNAENAAEKLPEVEELKESLEFGEAMEGMEELIQNIATGASRTAEIVRELRTFARLDEANLKLIDIHQSIDSTLVMLRSHHKDRIEILRQYGDLPSIECYPGKLNQVFMNLLVNAVQAIEEEGRITITTQHLAEQGQVGVVIADTGSGIPKEIREKIFEPFYTSKDVGEGTGLGLSISLSIIQSHSGTIQMSSEQGEGTTFRILLPLLQKSSSNGEG